MVNPRRRKQTVVHVDDGEVTHVALCRGWLDALPVFGWNEAPPTLLTRSQLRQVELRPNGQDPVALLMFRHHKPYRRETVAELFSVHRAATCRPGRAGNTTAANLAWRTCRDCRQVRDYRMPTSTRVCGQCPDTAQDIDTDLEVAA